MEDKLENSADEYLYESRTSGMVRGTSSDRWDAYLFRDDYYENSRDCEWSLQAWEDDSSHMGIVFDPMTA